MARLDLLSILHVNLLLPGCRTRRQAQVFVAVVCVHLEPRAGVEGHIQVAKSVVVPPFLLVLWVPWSFGLVSQELFLFKLLLQFDPLEVALVACQLFESDLLQNVAFTFFFGVTNRGSWTWLRLSLEELRLGTVEAQRAYWVVRKGPLMVWQGLAILPSPFVLTVTEFIGNFWEVELWVHQWK